eukprot:TRINITY_DN615_c0_g1_i6.p1 TRINITY_DN615_c0_g1~~TRINITY_DN615_c0_g1_i6.p1  ORF type:complete len:298 (+),score=59.87 TRINITY_DN615_c0_g1_i6:94-894(+)
MASRLLAAAGAQRATDGVAAKGSGELLVYVRTDSGTVPVTVDAGGTVGCLTEAVAAAMDTNSRQIALLLKGERLDSGGRDVLLADCGVSQEVCLTLQVHAPFKCIAHHEELSVTAIEGSPSPAYSLLLARRSQLDYTIPQTLAFFDPPLSTDGHASWHIEADARVRSFYLMGLTAREHTDVQMGGFGSHDAATRDPMTWCFQECGSRNYPAGTMSLLLSRRQLKMTVRSEADSTQLMDLAPGVTVRFFVCLVGTGAAMNVRMEGMW